MIKLNSKSLLSNFNGFTKAAVILTYLRISTLVFNTIYIFPITLVFIFMLWLVYKYKIKKVYKIIMNALLIAIIIFATIYHL